MRTKIFLLVLLLTQIACYSRLDIQHATLNTGLLEEYYEYDFEVDTGWDDIWDDSMSVQLVEGDLPDGMGISAEGLLFGDPQEVGDFEFRVAIYDIDEGADSESWSDSEWFTLFITEPSTNEECPSPDDEESNEFYVCTGSIEEELVETDDEINLDVNLFVNRDNIGDFDITAFAFTITYDSTYLSLNEDDLNSGLLREAATRNEASVDFDSSTPGVLVVTIASAEDDFVRAGRILDIPFQVLSDVPDGTYAFDVTIDSVTGKEGATLPEAIAIDGELTVGSTEED